LGLCRGGTKRDAEQKCSGEKSVEAKTVRHGD
jgi:hypothetical protein